MFYYLNDSSYWLVYRMMALWMYSKGWTTWSKKVFSKRYTFPCYRASHSRVMTTQSPFTTRIKCIVISVHLNFVCYLISYTTLFMKLNLFEILFYITFITTKVSRSTVYVCCLLDKQMGLVGWINFDQVSQLQRTRQHYISRKLMLFIRKQDLYW